MPEIKLKPCPFCGGKAELCNSSWFNDAWVRCPRCEASTTIYKCTEMDAAKEQAIKAWNHRADGWHKWPEEKPKKPGAYIATLKDHGEPCVDAILWTGRAWGGIRIRCVYDDSEIFAWHEFPEPWEGE